MVAAGHNPRRSAQEPPFETPAQLSMWRALSWKSFTILRWTEFTDAAALDAGRLPHDVANDAALLDGMEAAPGVE